VKHGGVNATVHRDRIDALTLDEALRLLAAKSGKSGVAAASRSAVATKPKRSAGTGQTAKKTAPPKAAQPRKRTKRATRRRAS